MTHYVKHYVNVKDRVNMVQIACSQLNLTRLEGRWRDRNIMNHRAHCLRQFTYRPVSKHFSDKLSFLIFSLSLNPGHNIHHHGRQQLYSILANRRKFRSDELGLKLLAVTWTQMGRQLIHLMTASCTFFI